MGRTRGAGAVQEARPFLEEQELAKLIDALHVTREVTISFCRPIFFFRGKIRQAPFVLLKVITPSHSLTPIYIYYLC